MRLSWGGHFYFRGWFAPLLQVGRRVIGLFESLHMLPPHATGAGLPLQEQLFCTPDDLKN